MVSDAFYISEIQRTSHISGTPKAVVAAAHKLARIVYPLLKERVPFEAIPPEQADFQYRERAIHQLQRKAQQLGVTVVVELILQST